ncbi:MAG: Ser-Thr-rich GPI-anchored membrane family protein [Chitinivibrionales bacterium]|nr:Ser-Thr-rich GPI-anchored membrane family protein [Chitinivibrionales bacterium]
MLSGNHILYIALIEIALLAYVSCTKDTPIPTHITYITGASANGFFNVGNPYYNQVISVDTSLEIWYNASNAVLGKDAAVYLYKGDTLAQRLTDSLTSGYPYYWHVYASLPKTGDDYRIRIVNNSDTTQNDFGPFFRIFWNDLGAFAITTSSGDTTLQGGSAFMIHWNSLGNADPYVRLQLYDDTVFAQTITPLVNNSDSGGGAYSWKVGAPAGSGDRYRIKIVSIRHPRIAAYSGYFKITSQYYGSYRVIWPDSSTAWASNNGYTIRWTDSGNVGSYTAIKLYRGDDSLLLIDNIESDTCYSWVLPRVMVSGSNYRIKISSNFNSSLFVFSDLFSIAGIGTDLYEPDNSRALARTIVGGVPQKHTLTFNDTDWFKFTANSGQYFLFHVAGAPHPVIHIYREYSTMPLINLLTSNNFTVIKTGTYYASAAYSSDFYGDYTFSLTGP